MRSREDTSAVLPSMTVKSCCVCSAAEPSSLLPSTAIHECGPLCTPGTQLHIVRKPHFKRLHSIPYTGLLSEVAWVLVGMETRSTVIDNFFECQPSITHQ